MSTKMKKYSTLPDHRNNHRAGGYWGAEDETGSQLLFVADVQLEILEAGS